MVNRIWVVTQMGCALYRRFGEAATNSLIDVGLLARWYSLGLCSLLRLGRLFWRVQRTLPTLWLLARCLWLAAIRGPRAVDVAGGHW